MSLSPATIVPTPGPAALPRTLLEVTPSGLYCAAGGFYIDPARPVERAVITHAHADHARPGSRRYLASAEGLRILRRRLGDQARIETAPYGHPVALNGVRVSLHPAGHILGSAQVRIEHRGEIWVVSGDYKTTPDPTCAPFEPVPCHTFVTESTFGLPAFEWPAEAAVLAEIDTWWRANQEAGRASLLFAYALGKAQRLLAGLDPRRGPIYTHGAVEGFTHDYRASGIALPATERLHGRGRGHGNGRGPGASWARALILAPPGAHGTPFARELGPLATGLASGWMLVPGAREQRGLDRGFVLSDHADFPGLLAAIDATGAERVWIHHGPAAALAARLAERGREARAIDLPTTFKPTETRRG